MRVPFLALVMALALAFAPTLGAQTPAADWRTRATPTFRVHYPAPAAPWVDRVAPRLEGWLDQVGAEVGYRPAGPIDVLVVDPLAAANGSAWPIRPFPRLVLYTTPPAADSSLGFFHDWRELLIVHEQAHLAHLLRPSRQPWERALGRFWPAGPLARRSPNWVMEGYATLVEGRLTGFGRPHGDLRAALLRRWAQTGTLPGYGQLNGQASRFYGRSFPYLVGSAFLEWLEARQGPGALRQLWARLSAREPRDFDAGFAGLFGEPAAKLYGRFTAELTYQALAHERELPATPSALFLDLGWQSGAPALSADGEKLAIVLRRRGAPAELRVYATALDQEALEAREQRRAALLEADPDDVAGLAGPPPRRLLHSLRAVDGGDFFAPKFLGPDQDSLVYGALEPDADGHQHADLFRWWPGQERVERLTRGADLREPDPASDGRSLVAVRQRWGASSLLRLHLADGRLEEILPPTFDEVYASPRLSPDGRRLAYLAQKSLEGGSWRLIVRDLETGASREVAAPAADPARPGAPLFADPAFAPDGQTLYASVGQGGTFAIHAFEAGPLGVPPRLVARQPAAALAPLPTPDGRALFFLALEDDGFDLRRAELPAAAPPEAAPARADFQPAADLVRRGLPLPALPPPVPVGAVEEERRYGAGQAELLPLLAVHHGGDGTGVELGLRAGDVVGRWEGLAIVGLADGGLQGALLAAEWRGRPWALRLQAAHLEEGELGEQRQIAALSTRRTWLGRGRRFEAAAGIGAEDSASWLFAELGAARRLDLGTWAFGAAGRFRWDSGEDRDRRGVDLRLEIERAPADGRALRLGLEVAHHRADEGSYRWGGTPQSLLPAELDYGRLERPGLAEATRVAAEHQSERLDLGLGAWPLALFGERHRFDEGPREELYGAEWLQRFPAQPLLRLPAAEVRLGLLRWQESWRFYAFWRWKL